MNLIRTAIDRPIAVVAAVLMVVMFGLVALENIPIQLAPDVNRPVITIKTNWPGAAPAEVVFTASGTEANNLALEGCGRAQPVVSAVEHDSMLRAAPEARLAPVDCDGVVDLAVLDEILSQLDEPALVSVMLANNETGVAQPAARAPIFSASSIHPMRPPPRRSSTKTPKRMPSQCCFTICRRSW